MKITGMKKAVGEYRRAKYATLFVDCSTGEVWTNEYVSGNEVTEYHDPMIRDVSYLTFTDVPYREIEARLSAKLDRINAGEITIKQAEIEHENEYFARWNIRP